MTISSETRKAGPFTGSGSTGPFPFTFKVFSSSNLLVVRADSAGAETTLTLTTDYTVSLNPDQNANPGGSVTLVSALASGYTMVVSSVIPYTQETDITNAGGFYPNVIEDALDRLTIEVQQIREQLGRNLVTPITDSAANLTIPGVADRSGQVLGFDATGQPSMITSPDYAAAAAAAIVSGYVARSSSTGSAELPSGTTAQRDITPATGWTRYNTTLGVNETWNGSAWTFDIQMTGPTGSAKVPSGTTAQRDVAPSAGFTRWNTTIGAMETYSGSAWFYDVPVTGTTGSAKLPSGTTAQRDGSPAEGWFRMNTTLGCAEWYNGSAWIQAGIGFGQTWTDVTSSRAMSTTYTNSTGRPIVISVYGTGSGVASGYMLEDVATGLRQYGQTTNLIGGNCSITAIVPAGGQYKLLPLSGSNTISNWNELR